MACADAENASIKDTGKRSIQTVTGTYSRPADTQGAGLKLLIVLYLEQRAESQFHQQ